jgi:hypothetical protein
MVVWVAAAGITASVGLACALAIAEVIRSNRIVRRAQRIAALPEPQPTVDWAVWDEVFS